MWKLQKLYDNLGGLELNKLESIARCSESDNDSPGCKAVLSNSSMRTRDDRLDESCLPSYTLSDVRNHCTPSDCWIVVRDRIYNITNFLHNHPGGTEIIMENAGTDATFSFRGVGHSKMALDEMEKYCIGVLIESERLNLHIWRSSSIISTLSAT